MHPLLILGSGPAAAAAAIAAREAGVAVTMIGRGLASDFRFGETLPPEASAILCRIGCSDLNTLGHVRSPGVVSAWSGEVPFAADFIFSPQCHGWHLDRATFDRQLLDIALDRGAELIMNVRLRSVERIDDGWVVAGDRGGEPLRKESRFLIDATGRSGWLARRLGVERQKFDNLIAIVGFFQNASSGDARTVLEAARDGWWYGARLPNYRSVVAYMTDVDIAAEHAAGPRGLWWERLSQATLIPAHLALSEALSRPCETPAPEMSNQLVTIRVVAAHSERLTIPQGPGWLAIGDAAGCWDPLSSQGIMTAIEGGVRGVTAAISADPHSLHEYATWFNSLWERYRQSFTDYYGQVRRWPLSPFWVRRQSR